MKVIICGSRNWQEQAVITHVVYETVRGLVEAHGADLTILHGAARGVDSIAATYAEKLGVTTKSFPARWLKHGKAAGPIRNREMLAEQPDVVYAFFWQDDSPGTQDMVDIAGKAQIPARIFRRLKGWQTA